jgi:hypothetical protein
MIRKTFYLFIFYFSYMISTMFLVFTILFLINIIQIDSDLASCRQTFGSNRYDLNQLSGFTIVGEQAIYRYAITPCGLVPTSQCGENSSPFDPGMTSCQINLIGPIPRFESPMGFLDGYGKLPNLQFTENTDGPGTGVIMTMRNARCSGVERLVKVIFICDRGVKIPTRMDAVEAPQCQFTIRIKADGACPISPGPGPTPTPGPGPSGNTGTSGGTVFIIILLVLSAVYVIGTVSYNRFKENRTGLALLPHPTFWLLLCGLLMDGCRFTLSSIRARCEGRS